MLERNLGASGNDVGKCCLSGQAWKSCSAQCGFALDWHRLVELALDPGFGPGCKMHEVPEKWKVFWEGLV